MKYFIYIVLFLSLPVQSSNYGKIVLRANYDKHGVMVQHALMINGVDKEILGSRNSNFLCGADSKVFLGKIAWKAEAYDLSNYSLFSNMAGMLKNRSLQMEELEKKLEKESLTIPHEITIHLNKLTVKNDREANLVMNYFHRRCSLFRATMSLEEGYRYFIKTVEGKNSKVSYQLWEEEVKKGKIEKAKEHQYGLRNCQKKEAFFECTIPGRGLALLRY